MSVWSSCCEYLFHMHITSLTDLSRPSELLQLELSTLNVLIIKPQNNNAID